MRRRAGGVLSTALWKRGRQDVCCLSPLIAALPPLLTMTAPAMGDTVSLDGVEYTVQYVTSKGTLDLKSKEGNTEYGVDPATVTIVPPAAPAPVMGDTVTMDGTLYTVQYVTSKGMLDLKSKDGDTQYGVDPASVTVVPPAAPAPVMGDTVKLDGVEYTVQYITSKGMLDLKSKDGNTEYGVDPTTVTIVPAAAPAPVMGDTVSLNGVEYKVTYITSKGTLDLKSKDGNTEYGVDPSTVTIVPAAKDPTMGDTVTRNGAEYTVAYITSKGLLDLKPKNGGGGDTEYGVDPASVTLVSGGQSSSAAAAATAATAAPPPPYDPSGLLGTVITLWDGGIGYKATVVELDHTTGKNLLKVQFAQEGSSSSSSSSGTTAPAASKEDEWIDRRRLKQANRVEAVAEVNAKWESEQPPQSSSKAAAAKAAAAAKEGSRRGVTINPLPAKEEVDGVEGLPEWVSGERPKPPSSSSMEQIDGKFVTVDKYPVEAVLSRSYSRATTLEQSGLTAARKLAREFDQLTPGQVAQVGTSVEMASLIGRWRFMYAMRGVTLAEPEEWAEQGEGGGAGHL